jgi:regulatory protein
MLARPKSRAKKPETEQASRGRARTLSGENETALADAALRYLDRYDATEQGLRRLLTRKLDPELGAAERALAEEKIAALIERFRAAKILDDTRYAQNLTSSLRARGSSGRRIQQKLRQRGVGDGALRELEPEAQGTELEAARTFLRKRRWIERKPSKTLNSPSSKPARLDPELAFRNKVLAALGRQGFSFEIARQAFDLEQGESAREAGYSAVPDDLADEAFDDS